jgi:drug/metabolite transporter (DMT)-like permease
MPVLASLSPNLRGALWMLASTAIFSVMAALIKQLGPAVPTAQIIFFRCLFGLMAMAPFVVAHRRELYPVRRPHLHLLRAAFSLTGMAAYFWTLTTLPIAASVALGFTKPLFLIVLAVLFLGERVRWRRSLATLVGFLGVLVMVDPEGSVGLVPVLVGLAGGLATALAITTIKAMSRTERPAVMVFSFTFLSALAALGPALWVWVTPTPQTLALLVTMGLFGTAGQYMAVRALSVGEATLVVPVEYAALLFAGLIGFVAFDEVPAARVLVGAAIIVASTLYIALREARLRQPIVASREAGPDLL